jgi:iron complex outermembrane receptor protein
MTCTRPTGVQHYAGTLGPYDLSSGNGTPSWRGNWQNTLESALFDQPDGLLCRTDQGSRDRSGQSVDRHARQPVQDWSGGDKFCYVSPFITTDLNFTARVHDDFTFFFNVKNLFDAHAPVAPAAYASAPNFLTTWHYAGLIGRQFRAGATFKF